MADDELPDDSSYRLLRSATSSLSSLLPPYSDISGTPMDSDSDYASEYGADEPPPTIVGVIASITRQGIHFISTTIFRVSNYSNVSELLKNVDMGAVVFALGGAWLGKRLRRQFSTIWLVTTAAVFACKLLIEWGYVTVHWDRIASTRQNYPVLDRCMSAIPTTWAMVRSVTAGTWFSTGFLLGFRYGFPYGL